MRSDQESILIVGAGAVGCSVATALIDSGHRPVIAVRTPFDELRRNFAGDIKTYSIEQLRRPDPTLNPKWVFLCTKAYDTEAGLQWLPETLAAQATVAVLQNGVDHRERLGGRVSPAQVLPVIVRMAIERDGPGQVRHSRRGLYMVPDTQRGRQFAALFSDTTAFEVQAEPEFVSRLWQKLALNGVNGGICALTLQPNAILANAAVYDLAASLMKEVMAVGRAEGAVFPERFVEDTLALLIGPAGDHWTSIAADRRDGRQMEWEVRNAVVGRLGRKHGIATPLNDVITTLMSVTRPVA